MLNELTINNFGLINSLNIDLEKGLNILTGETGAGKSIIIDALRFVLGERLNSSQIRDKDKPCTIEAVYEINNESVIIKRSYTPDGKNKIKVNGDSFTVGQLKQLGDTLTDFHGPHDHQMLLNKDNHIIILDRLANINSKSEEYAKCFTKLATLKNQLNHLANDSQNREREIDTLLHQINELEQVPLVIETHNELLAEQTRINNTEALYKHASALNSTITNDELSFNELLRTAFTQIQCINKIDKSTNQLVELLNSIQEQTDQLSSEMSCYCDSLSYDQDRAQEVNEICDKYNTLKRKYGNSFAEVLDFYNKSKQRLLTLQDFELNDETLRTNIESTTQLCNKFAALISKQRKSTAKSLEKSIKIELKDLGIKNIEFQCKFSRVELRPNGYDELTFYISPNAGEELKPLAEIISSGEAARVMLAMKKVLTDVDPIPVLIFDEIDAQIGGRLGSIIGEKLTEISQNRQILLITHLPQIAAFADLHLKVEKTVKNNTTNIKVIQLKDDSRINEISHMMSGDTVSKLSLQHARDLLEQAKL